MSEIRATTISDSAGTGPITLTGQSAAKAWCGWVGTSTVTITDSFNTSSITDVGTGTYTVNYSSSFNSIGYAVSLAGKESTGSSHNSNVDRLFNPARLPYETGLTKVTAVNLSGTVQDLANCTSATHGDLA